MLKQGSETMIIKSVGFPRIKNFGGDIRDFLPSLFQYLKKFENLEIFAEKGYGSGFGLTGEDYLEANPRVKFVTSDEIYQKDLIVILKMPELEELEKLRDGCALFTMCHYSTRLLNVELFVRKRIKTFSMDSIVDDDNMRIFVDYFRTAFNASRIAFKELKKTMADFYSPTRRPINVTVIGVGSVAQNCAKSFEILGDEEFLDKNIPGVVIRLLPRTVTYSDKLMISILKETDILVDASKRQDLSKCIIKNELLGYLPNHSIILDITADRYDIGQVKPIEGTVVGSLSKLIIYPDDELYDTLPRNIESKNRRITVSCDAWPGVTPKESIIHYERLIKNFLEVLLNKDTDEIDKNSDNYFERALYRGTLEHFFSNSVTS